MFVFLTLSHLVSCWSTVDVDRLLQFSPNVSDSTSFGSTRASFDSALGDFNSKPDSNQAVIVDLEKITLDELKKHLNVSSPIIIQVPEKQIDTSELEKLLLKSGHKSPIYFAYGNQKIPTNYTYVKTIENPSNSGLKKVKLQNVVATMNSSKTFDRQRIAIISAPFDSFSVVPSANIGANRNGIALAAFLESMRLVSKFPVTNNWVLMFALVDGQYCAMEGLEHFINSISTPHGFSVEFALSLENIASKTLKGHFATKLKRDSAFTKFMYCLKDALNTTGIPFECDLSEEKHGQLVYGSHLLSAISITAPEEEDDLAHITDFKSDDERANDIAWAVSEALLRMMYNTDNSAVMVERRSVNASYWTKVAMQPRMVHVRDPKYVDTIAQWMSKFGQVKIDRWTTTNCPKLYSATKSKIVLYNRTPASVTLTIIIGTIIYGIIVLLAVGRQKLQKFFN